jgi:NAD(P)-dependent dehydrogenase (short-subunit alcohol dehydrogenase family)
MRLDGKVALITGAAGGQGAAEALLFAREGAKLVLGDVNDQAGSLLADKLAQSGAQAVYARLDVREESDWRAAIGLALTRYGKLNVLINNAGITGEGIPGGFANVEDTSLEGWDKVMSVNARGAFLGTKLVIPEMRRAGGGAIVNISSVGGMEARMFATAYAMSKSAIRLLTKTTAVQFGRDNIRCNTILPGLIETEMIRTTTLADPEKRRRSSRRMALGRIGKPEEIAYCALFLASDESSFVTGAELVADGGTTAGAGSVAADMVDSPAGHPR